MLYGARFETERLPIYDLEHDIVASLNATKRLVLQSPTGSGKSTQVPQMLLKHGLLGASQCVILQPRRLAARLLASRVAKELGVELGREVGYQVRFEHCVSDVTQIKFETEGILLPQLIQDPTLRGVRAVIFDEFHERHLHSDLALALCRDAQAGLRDDLRLLIMSATLDGQGIAQRFAAPLIQSEGRSYPVALHYLPREAEGPLPERVAG